MASSALQKRKLMGRTSGRLAAKSISITGGGCRFGRGAAKAVILTSGDLRRAGAVRLRLDEAARHVERVGEVSRGHSRNDTCRTEGPNGRSGQ